MLFPVRECPAGSAGCCGRASDGKRYPICNPEGLGSRVGGPGSACRRAGVGSEERIGPRRGVLGRSPLLPPQGAQGPEVAAADERPLEAATATAPDGLRFARPRERTPSHAPASRAQRRRRTLAGREAIPHRPGRSRPAGAWWSGARSCAVRTGSRAAGRHSSAPRSPASGRPHHLREPTGWPGSGALRDTAAVLLATNSNTRA